MSNATWDISRARFRLLGDQFTGFWLWTSASSLVGVLGSASVLVLARLTNRAVSRFTADPMATAGLPFYTGMLSNLGIMLWSATAAACLLASLLLFQLPRHRSSASFLLASGLFTLLLAFDDAFLFHEEVFPLYLGVPELVVYASYALIALAFVLFFARQVLKTNYPLLALAVGFLGSSLAYDIFVPYGNWQTFVEDSLKWFGIVFWAAYFFHTAATLLWRFGFKNTLRI